jgi:glycosyltransferase involved in cell wall biosynthesis
LTRSLRISVVIPSAAAPDVFEDVLVSVFNQDIMPYEVICVDDAMDQKAMSITSRFTEKYPLLVIKNSGTGVSAARNTGAVEASGDVILFIDTDVVLKPDALALITKTLDTRPEFDGVVGVQTADLRYDDFFSRWKNHWMRFTYQRLSGDVHLFYTSCAALRRETFLTSGGFDENYQKPSVEDTAFGAVLGRMGTRILPVPEFEVEHVKSYSMKSALKTDFYRSAALVRYTLRNLRSGYGTGAGKTSVPNSFIAGAVLMATAWISIVPAIFVNPLCVLFPVAVIVLLWLLNSSWLMYLFVNEGVTYCLKSMLFLPLNVTFVDAGMIYGVITYLTGTRY